MPAPDYFPQLNKEIEMVRISAILTLIFVFALSSAAMADKPDNRGRGKAKKTEKIIRKADDREDKRQRKIEKKDEKFENNHDARDGREDGKGKGPKRN